MPARRPIVAGTFYPADKVQLEQEIESSFIGGRMIRHGSAPANAKAMGAMLPHAGYVYCAKVIGATLDGLNLPPKLVLLCPNHTGRGQALGVWPEGEWFTPLGGMPVDAPLVEEICNARAGFVPDRDSHLGEHSLEVIIPFLQVKGISAIVPVCAGTQDPSVLERAGHALGQILAAHPEIGIVASSDMNHYDDLATTMTKDKAALDRVLANDPSGLLAVVRKYHITMCGAGPAALAMYAFRALGKLETVLVAHDTSATASGDSGRVVGYAGARFYLLEAGSGQGA